MKVCQIYVEILCKQTFGFRRCLLFHTTIVVISNQHKRKISKSIQYTIFIMYFLFRKILKLCFNRSSEKERLFFLKLLFFFLAGSFLDVKGNKQTNREKGKNKNCNFLYETTKANLAASISFLE